MILYSGSPAIGIGVERFLIHSKGIIVSNTADTNESKQIPATDETAQETIIQEVAAEELDEVSGGKGPTIGISIGFEF